VTARSAEVAEVTVRLACGRPYVRARRGSSANLTRATRTVQYGTPTLAAAQLGRLLSRLVQPLLWHTRSPQKVTI
jgi:hypothetical protein